MKTERISPKVFTVFIALANVATAIVGRAEGLPEALNHAGGNREGLEAALREVDGKDTEYLIASASQYDLLNRYTQISVNSVPKIWYDYCGRGQSLAINIGAVFCSV